MTILHQDECINLYLPTYIIKSISIFAFPFISLVDYHTVVIDVCFINIINNCYKSYIELTLLLLCAVKR